MDAGLIQTLHDRLRAALGDQFEIGEPLGAGGFAAVFRARDPLLRRDVAIKVFDPSLSLSAAASDRLLTEARLVARGSRKPAGLPACPSVRLRSPGTAPRTRG